ncbi:unnamed protein product [Phaeothamnion confervicola]
MMLHLALWLWVAGLLSLFPFADSLLLCVPRMRLTRGAHQAVDLAALSRSELQAKCKSLGLRAVGKTSLLRERLEERHRQQSELTEPSTESNQLDLHQLAAPVTPSLPDALSLASAREAFLHLSDEQWRKVELLCDLIQEWNGRLNLVSRKDVENIFQHHVLPCLALANALPLAAGATVLDVGTGGGLPGLPLAICNPHARFTLVDARGKKIAAVADMARQLGLMNVDARHARIEEVDQTYDYVVGRAVAALPTFVEWIEKNLRPNDSRAAASAAGNTAASAAAATGRGVPLQTSAGAAVELIAVPHPSVAHGLLYMRGAVADIEYDSLGARPVAVSSVEALLGGAVGDHWAAGGARGYSQVLHFTSEALWGRKPAAPGSGQPSPRQVSSIAFNSFDTSDFCDS